MVLSLGVILFTVVVGAALAVERWRLRLPVAVLETEPPVFSEYAALPLQDDGSARTFVPAIQVRASILRAGFVFGLILLIVGQIDLNTGYPARSSFLLWFAGLITLVIIEWQCAAIPLPVRPVGAESWTRTRVEGWRWLLLAPVMLASLYILDATPGRSQTDTSLDIVALWLLSIIGIVLASGALPGYLPRADWRASVIARRTWILLASAVVAFAAVPRLYNLSSYAWSMSGDEGTFAITARSTLEGQLRNPFSSGPWGYPSLLFIIQGWFIDLLGGSVGSARTLSALFGIGSVLAVWLLVRDHFGPYPALLAAMFCASMHMHVYWSRDAQNASAPMFFFPLALFLLDRGLLGKSRLYSVGAGLTIAFSQFFHPANRLLLPMAIAYLVYALGLISWEKREVSMRVWGETLSNGLWTTAVVIVGHLPLIAYFEANRGEFWSRTNEVSVFESGWLAQEQIITGDSAIQIMARQLWHAFLAPFSHVTHGHYRPEVPLVGWPLVIFVAFGCALATVWFLRRSYFPFALGFWVVTIGLAFTNGPPMTNRYTAATPFLAALGAIGLWGIASIVARLTGAPRRLVLSVTTLVAVFIVFWNLQFYFHDPNQVNLYSDENSQIANGIAREAEDLGPGTTVYLAGAPRLFYYGFQNLPFIAPNAVGVDVDPMWSESRLSPEITGPTLFVFTPERIDEMQVVRNWFPDGVQTEHFLPDGSLLYVSYLVETAE